MPFGQRGDEWLWGDTATGLWWPTRSEPAKMPPLQYMDTGAIYIPAETDHREAAHQWNQWSMMPQPANKDGKSGTAHLEGTLLDTTKAHREALVAAWALAATQSQGERDQKLGKSPTWRYFNRWEDLVKVNFCAVTRVQKQKLYRDVAAANRPENVSCVKAESVGSGNQGVLSSTRSKATTSLKGSIAAASNRSYGGATSNASFPGSTDAGGFRSRPRRMLPIKELEQVDDNDQNLAAFTENRLRTLGDRFKNLPLHEKQRQAASYPNGVMHLDASFARDMVADQHIIALQEAALKALMVDKVAGGSDRKRDTKADNKAENSS